MMGLRLQDEELQVCNAHTRPTAVCYLFVQARCLYFVNKHSTG